MTGAGAHEWVPYCGVAPTPAEVLGRWNFDPLLLGVLALVALGIWFVRDASRGPLLVGAGVLGLVLFVSPFCAMTSALFSARVVHHVLLTAVVAPLIAYAVARARNSLFGPLAAWTVLHAAIFWIWHAPSLYSAALDSEVVYWLMQLTLLGSALGLWLSVRRSSPPAAVGALLVTMVQMGLLGALITFAGSPLYEPHLATTGPWGLSALEDQQLAGLIMWAPSAAVYLGAALCIAGRWLRAERPLAAG